MGEPFPGRKSSSSFRGSFSGGAQTSTERCQSDKQRFVLLPVFQIGEKRGLVGYHQHSYGRKSHVSE